MLKYFREMTRKKLIELLIIVLLLLWIIQVTMLIFGVKHL